MFLCWADIVLNIATEITSLTREQYRNCAIFSEQIGVLLWYSEDKFFWDEFNFYSRGFHVPNS